MYRVTSILAPGRMTTNGLLDVPARVLTGMEYTDDLKPVIYCSIKQDVAFYRQATQTWREIGSFAPHIRLSGQHPYLLLDLGEVVAGLGLAPSARAELIDLPQVLPHRRGNDEFECLGLRGWF